MLRLLFTTVLAFSVLLQPAERPLQTILNHRQPPANFIQLPVCRNGISSVHVPRAFEHHSTLFATRFIAEGWSGLLRSVDGGNTWQGLSVADERNFAWPVFSPVFATDRTLFSKIWSPVRLLRSEDAGDTWLSHALPATPGVIDLVPVSGTELFAGSSSGPPGVEGDQGVFYSSDLGAHWERRWVGAVATLAASPDFAVDHTLLQGDHGLYKSTDAGMSWTPIMSGLSGRWTGAGISQIGFSPRFASDHTVFVLHAQDVHRSTDAGEHWVKLTNDVPNQGWSTVFIVSPRFPQDRTLWREDVWGGLYVSSDAGGTWRPLSYDLTLQDAGTVCDGNGTCGVELFATHYNQPHGYSAYRSYNYGRTWECLPPPAQHSLFLPYVSKTGTNQRSAVR